MKTRKTLFALIAIFLALPLSAATTWYVRADTGDDTNGDGTLAKPWKTFTTAYGKAAVLSGDVLDVSGTFTTDYGRSFGKSITIQGNDKTTAIFDGTAGNATMKNFANMTSAGVIIVIENVTFQNYSNYSTSASMQGGVLSVGSSSGATSCSVTCRNVVFRNNKSTSGGAIQVAYSNNLTLEDCYFVGNEAKDFTTTSTTSGSGGALYISTSTNAANISINRCLFEANKSFGGSGAALIYQSTAVSGTASAGLTLTNSTFTGNVLKYNSATTPVVGDGIVNLNPNGTGASAILTNNTVAYNASDRTTSGGTPGIYVRGVADHTTLINNILFSNFDTQTTPVSTSIGSNVNLYESRNNITDVASGTFDWTTKTTSAGTMASGNVSGVVNATLLLASSLADNGGSTKTLALTTGSSAVNAGYTVGTPLTVDQRNVARVGIVDVGAYEFSGVTSVSSNYCESDFFNVISSGVSVNLEGRLMVYSMHGKIMKELMVTGGQFIKLEAGIYIVRFVSKNKVDTKKIII